MRLDIPSLPINKLVSIYMIASYCYYHRYESVLPDTDYDLICKRLYKEYDNITHQHKEHLDKESLKAGTAYQISTYPTIVMCVGEDIMRGEYEDWN